MRRCAVTLTLARDTGGGNVRAVRFDQYGGRDVLYIADVEIPTASAGEVVVAVRAAALNPGEAAIRSGAMEERFPATFPSGEGSDLAGVVHAIGEGVSQFAVGDDVLGWSERRSSHAEFVAVPVTQLIGKPASMSWDVAGSLYVVGCTGFVAVRAVDVSPGDVVAVSAAAGGVGTVVVQLLRTKGATVLGIASEAHHEWLEAHGVTPVTYGEGLADRLKAHGRIDAFIDLFGPDYVQLAVDLGIPKDRIETIISFEKAFQLGTKAQGSAEGSTTEVLSAMADLVASGQIEIPIAGTYPLEKVRDAYAELEKRHTLGKIVLVP
jgi:NADPH:quinone reductase-like Zn-dependent oxidoreductase